ncbi:MAG: SDR family NAD(P)-dependent oxidoreductase [Erysipelotrichaceae bacterium]|uniref:SDR family NAD(P)-dependent oxidoreductase n=1 Tax=Floccifex sp. TaxID=2815810 RepID=UPI002A764585|nr:SDR family oxidoreductase [Floccifex sp.]MDD7281457.1 SDR family NAD(P)-dependent oxidoreductase [Erysipelotrichaceae bacterium]MDY2958883.1 SDR family oxidoreductase [Floccifex sp.]
MGRLDGKVAIITGGNSGVGKVTALRFAQEGAKVVISARREGPLMEVADEIKKAGGDVLPVICDISKPEDAKKLVSETVKHFGTVDILVNNAGILEKGLKPIDKVEDEDLDRILNTNTKGTMYCIREAVKEMEAKGKGAIVNVASIAGIVGGGGAAYVASKSAVIGITRHTALRYAGTQIRCNAVCPGTIITPMVMNARNDALDENMFGQMAKHSDMKVQPCMPEDVANIVLFLASDESRAITGQAIASDFGSTL